MAEVYVDGVRHHIAETEGTLGDLLRVLDTQATAARHVVTDVRLDGIDEPAFRDPSIVVRSLATLGRLEVTTSFEAALVRQCAGDAARAAYEMSTRVLELAALFRRHQVEAGTAGLGNLSECLRTFAGFVPVLLAQSVGVHQASPVMITNPEAELPNLGGWLSTLLEAHANQDWVSVSDVLEYDLAPALRRWERALRTLAI